MSESFGDSKGNRQLFYPEFNSPATNFGIARDADGSQSHSTFVSASYKDFTFHAVYDVREKHIPTAPYGTAFGDSRTENTNSRDYTYVRNHHTSQPKFLL